MFISAKKAQRFDDPMTGSCPSESGLQSSQNSLDPNTVHQVPIKWHDADAAQVSGL